MSLSLRCGPTSARVALDGAELRSLTLGGQQLLWQPDPAVWHQSAPWLFPFVGRLRGGGYRHAGKAYRLPIHGFAHRCRFEVALAQDTRLRLELRESAATRAVYPFAFRLGIDYRLQADALDLQFNVDNLGAEPMPFGFGGHPGFALPGLLDDWALLFDVDPGPEVWRLDPAVDLLAAKPETLDWQAPGRLRLGADRFARDALIWKRFPARRITLQHRERGEHLAMQLLGDGAPQFGCWARPAAPYVCLEPWWGHDDAADAPDALIDKPQLLRLPAGERWTAGFRLQLA